MVMSLVDSHRQELGIEPICRELALAPSSYHEHAVRLADPGKRSLRARRDDDIKEQIKRVHDDNSGLYGTRKVWRQMRREGIKVAKCTVERLMRHGTGGRKARKDDAYHCQQSEGSMPAGQGESRAPCQPGQRSVGGRLYLRAHMGGLCVRGLRDRRLRPTECWPESQHFGHRGGSSWMPWNRLSMPAGRPQKMV
jgi:hypothetical protein